MFIKLKNQYSIKDYDTDGLQNRFGGEVDGQFKGIAYYHANTPSVHKIIEVIPFEYRQDFSLTLMKINTAIPPHTDNGIKAAINFYIHTNNCVTQFYFPSKGAARRQLANQIEGYIFDEAQLIPATSFMAEPTDAWLLDVSLPHSVIPMGDLKRRTAFTLATEKHAFNEVIEMLITTGAL